MDTLDKEVILLVAVVIVEQSSINHDWVVLLSNLVALGKIWVDIVLSIKLNKWRYAATESKRASDGLVETVFVQDGKHAGYAEIDKTHVGVWLLQIGAQGS